MRNRSSYGYRAKLGLIVPPTNTVNEAEWMRMVPDGVSFHTVRMPLHADTGSDAGRRALEADIGRAVSDLAAARVNLVAYGCTAGSMVNPPEALCRYISDRSGTAATTTAAAIVAALRALCVRRVAVATPYHDALNAHEECFLAALDFDVLGVRGLGIGESGPQDYVRIAETPLSAVRRHALDSFVDGAEAMVISCTDFPTLPIVEELEARLGVPVITSNQATFWRALREAGIDDRFDGFGRLLAEH